MILLLIPTEPDIVPAYCSTDVQPKHLRKHALSQPRAEIGNWVWTGFKVCVEGTLNTKGIWRCL